MGDSQAAKAPHHRFYAFDVIMEMQVTRKTKSNVE